MVPHLDDLEGTTPSNSPIVVPHTAQEDEVDRQQTFKRPACTNQIIARVLESAADGTLDCALCDRRCGTGTTLHTSQRRTVMVDLLFCNIEASKNLILPRTSKQRSKRSGSLGSGSIVHPGNRSQPTCFAQPPRQSEAKAGEASTTSFGLKLLV